MSELQPILSYFYHWESTTPEAPFLYQPQGKEWFTLTYRQAGEEVRQIAAALQARGLAPGTHVGIISKNCYHWILADLAITMAGYVSVPFFPNLAPRQLAEVIRLSDIRLLFAGKLETWHPEAIPEAVEIVSFPHYPGNVRIAEGTAWEELRARHPALRGNPLPDLDDLWTVLFTSGTTGTPKGVMLAHRAAAVILANEQENHDLGIFRLPEHRFFSFLPLNHVAERISVETACLLTGGTISFGESIATFGQNLRDTQPTFFFAVPRIWSKFQGAVLAKLPPRRLATLLRIPLLGPALKKRLRSAMGLSRAGVILTGAAPTPENLKQWYLGLGLYLREVYGMTETSGAVTVMPWEELRPGSVGKPLSGVEVRIDPENDELCVRLPWRMEGYYQDPELTARVLRDGWLHTGDKARVDEDGFVYIIGRVKDSFKTAKGKYVAPAPIEEGMASNDLVDQVCVVGSGLAQPLALVVLSEYGRTQDRTAVEGLLAGTLGEVNRELPAYARLSTLVLFTEEWTVENEMLTPTLKIRRSRVDERFGSHYGEWFNRKEDLVWA
ncbi:MAG: AMP-binding protein [Bacteroidota bacterium]